VYEETLNDMLQLEEEMMKIGSFYLNKAEMLQHSSAAEQPSTMLDRGEVALHLL
jgi:sialic acid synthase SpsE